MLEGKMIKVYFFLIPILFVSCGLVQRTMHPSRFFKLHYNLSRDVIIFAPNGYKVYYSFTDNYNDYIFDGSVNSNKHVIAIDEKYLETSNESNWSLLDQDDVSKVWIELGKRIRKKAYTVIHLKVLSPNGELAFYDYFNLWVWNRDGSMSYNNVQDYPEVKSLENIDGASDLSSSSGTIVIKYYPITIEVE